MLKLIIELLPLCNIGESELIDIAKGKNKIPKSFKEFKRQIKWQSKR